MSVTASNNFLMPMYLLPLSAWTGLIWLRIGTHSYMQVVGQDHALATSSQERDPVAFVQEAEWPVQIVMENLALTRVQTRTM
jgi:hypothetical protein